MDRSYSALKTVGLWFVAAGVLALLRAVIELAEPAYWSPESLLDYTAVILTSAASAVAAIALFLWWRATPIRRGSFLLLIAAIATAVGDSLGNLLEDVFDLEIGEWPLLQRRASQPLRNDGSGHRHPYRERHISMDRTVPAPVHRRFHLSR